MDQNNHHHHHHPTHCDTDSFSGFESWTTRGIDVKKKRKLLIEQLSLPTPKLPCLGPRSTSFPYGHNFKFNKNHPHQEEEEEEKSNLTKMAIEEVEMSKLEEVEVQGNKRDGIKDEMQRSYGHEEDLLEFGSHGNSCITIDEQYCSASDCAAQSSLLPKDSNHEFVLSSGRWSIDEPEAESRMIRPTIDQEFEQYFSVLLPSMDP